MPSQIQIIELKRMMCIGCTEQERSQPQPILIQCRVSSLQKFKACQTDRLSDTLDVDGLRTLLMEQAQSIQVATLERFAQLLEESIRAQFQEYNGLSWELTLTKPLWGWQYLHTWISS